MRRWTVICALVVTACTPGQEPATTPSVTPSVMPPVTSSAASPVAPSIGPRAQPSTTTSSPRILQSLAYVEIADLDFPVQMTARHGDEIAYVITKNGLVWGMIEGQIISDPILDISDRVRNNGEQGLLSIALHPTERQLLYLHYSDTGGNTVVSEFRFDSETEAAPDSERVLFSLDQPAGNHNGGMILFHPDGRLLVGLGDGGGQGDQFGNGQNTATFLGGRRALKDTGEPEPELFAYGLRNPWRFWIDNNSHLYIADVGQNTYEEVSIAPLAPNQNFGWPITEGLHCFRPSSDCNTFGLILPVLEVAHGDAGTCSITGGVVYRGAEIPELDGHYLYSDYCGGYLRSFRFNGMGEPLTEVDWTDQVGKDGSVTGFGVDGFGEVYVTTTVSLLKLIANR